MYTGTGPTVCAHCGRPIINEAMVSHSAGFVYHYACTRSPYEPQPQPQQIIAKETPAE